MTSRTAFIVALTAFAVLLMASMGIPAYLFARDPEGPYMGIRCGMGMELRWEAWNTPVFPTFQTPKWICARKPETIHDGPDAVRQRLFHPTHNDDNPRP